MIRRLAVSRGVGALAVIALCALPARGADPVSSLEAHTLTPIDTIPTLSEIVEVAGPDPIARLRDLALSGSTDFGVQLRAIRALPQFCAPTPTCADLGDSPVHPARLAVQEVLTSVSPISTDGRSILRLRAAIEALGAIKSGQQSDVDLLLPFLDHPSRDIRAATARALRDLCLASAIAPLRTRHEQEPVAQVRLQISAALGDLAQCSQ